MGTISWRVDKAEAAAARGGTCREDGCEGRRRLGGGGLSGGFVF